MKLTEITLFIGSYPTPENRSVYKLGENGITEIRIFEFEYPTVRIEKTFGDKKIHEVWSGVKYVATYEN